MTRDINLYGNVINKFQGSLREDDFTRKVYELSTLIINRLQSNYVIIF